MGTVTRTRLLMAAFCLSLCGLGLTVGASHLAQTVLYVPTVIDDGDVGFTSNGFTGPVPYPMGYGGDTAYFSTATNVPGTTASASWTFTKLTEATYEVYATWGEHPYRTTKAEYTLSTGGTTSVNQTKPPLMTIDNRAWHPIGTATIGKKGTLTVSLTAAKDSTTLADAVMVRRKMLPATTALCGNGLCEVGESAFGCDPVAGLDLCKGHVFCPQDCSKDPKPICGNKVIEGAEQCDDGNTNTADGCSNSCQLCPMPSCSAPQAGCTYVNDSAVGPNGCPLRPCGELKCNTTGAPVCGNGTIERPEECDDGNTKAGDGCSESCETETCPKNETCAVLESPVIIDDDNDANDTAFTYDTGQYLPAQTPGYTFNGTYYPAKVIEHNKDAYNNDSVLTFGNTYTTVTGPTWNFRTLRPGIYYVFATWGTIFNTYYSPVNAPGAREMYRLSTATTNSTRIVDQKTAPSSITHAGRGWEALGAIRVNQGETLSVSMPPSRSTDVAMADAVMVRRKKGAYCGDAVVEEKEECDDGNAKTGDGCNNCQLEKGSNSCKGPYPLCNGRNAECCPGSLTWTCPNRFTGASSCKKCGNGVIDAGESCDDGNTLPNDGCGATCRTEIKKVQCNDGIDNDGDWMIDLKDKGCASADDTNEADGATDISIGLVATPTLVKPGGSVTVMAYTKNNGPDTATTPFTIRMNVPTNATFDPVRSNKKCTLVDGSVLCVVDRLNALSTLAYQVWYTILAGENCNPSIVFESTLASTPQGDPNTSNNTATASIKVLCSVGAPCTDSDGGANENIRGKTVGLETATTVGQFEDYCGQAAEETGKLVEYVCNGEFVNKKLITCANGCADGACKAATIPPVSCTKPRAVGSAWQNQQNTVDVDGNGLVNTDDLNAVAAFLRTGTTTVQDAPPSSTFFNVDGSKNENGQETITNLDAFHVVSYIRCMQSQGAITLGNVSALSAS